MMKNPQIQVWELKAKVKAKAKHCYCDSKSKWPLPLQTKEGIYLMEMNLLCTKNASQNSGDFAADCD